MLRPARIRYYIAAMEARGYRADLVLAGCDLSRDRLFDSACVVDRQQRERVIANMIGLTRNPVLGLELGAQADVHDFGVVAYALLSARTIRQSVSIWTRFYQLAGETLPLRLQEYSGHWECVLDTENLRPSIRQFHCEEAMLMGMRLGKAISPLYELRSVNFSYAAPPHADAYTRFFSCPVRFDAPNTALVVGSPGLDQPLRGNDPEFNEMCMRHCVQIKRNIASSNPTLSRLRSLFRARPGALPSPDEAASHLGMSARSLRRHLSQQNTSYQDLANEVRRELAAEYLRSEQMSAKEVGYLLGFSNVTSFRRAFKTWTGRTVHQFQAEH